MNNERIETLIEEAFAARKMAYTPYSHFQVGAALLTEKGGIYRGCNIENAAYFKAVSEGERSFTAIAVVGGPEEASEFDWCAPCGVCRQVMKEFCHEDAFQIILARSVKEYKVYTLAELLPMGFGPDNLQ